MAFSLTSEQQAAVDNRGGGLLVSAAAGSGKTRVLVERLLARVEGEGLDIDRFLVITYTKAAAAELRGRIVEELSARLAERPTDAHLRRQATLVYKAQISTVHAFCAQLLRECGHLLELDPDFRLCDEGEAGILMLRALNDVLDRRYEDIAEGSDFARLVDTMSAGRDDSRLMQIVLDIRGRVQAHPNPAAWLDGQERAFALEGVDDPGETPWGRLLLDDAGRQGAYWRDKIARALELCPCDANLDANYAPSLSATLAALDAFVEGTRRGWDAARAALPIPFPAAGRKKIVDCPDAAEQVKAIRSTCKKRMEKLGEWFEDCGADLLEDLRAVHPAVRGLFALVKDFEGAYAAEKARRGMVDFADLEHMAVRLLVGEDGAPTELARQWSARYDEIMVDEYQDTNEVQNAIFTALSREGRNLFLVGDVKQSIYRFRLADPTIFLGKYRAFADYTRAAEGEERRLILSRNFRSRPEVLEGANFVFRSVMSADFGEMDYTADEALYPGAPFPPDGRYAVELDAVDASAEGEEEKTARDLIEARFAAKRIRTLVDGGFPVSDGEGGERPVRPADIVILLRSPNTVLHHYARALGERDIPWEAEGGGDFFAATEVNVALSLLQIVDNPRQDVPLISVLRSPVYGFSADRLAELRAASPDTDFYAALTADGGEDSRAFLTELDELRFGAGELSSHELLWQLYDRTNLLGVFGAMERGEERQSNLLTLAELARRFEGAGHKGLFGFLSYLTRLRENGAKLALPAPGREGGGVRILSIHKSKGLEFPVVLLCGLARRLNREDMSRPILFHPKLGVGPKRLDVERGMEYPTLARRAVARKLELEMMAEELRLLYVAMTRAQEKLILSVALTEGARALERLAQEAAVPVPAAALERQQSVGAWVLLHALVRPEAEGLRALAGGPEEIAAGLGPAWDIHWVQGDELEAGAEERPGRFADLEPERGETEDLTAALTWTYPYEAAVSMPSKLTATQLKGRVLDQEAAQEGAELGSSREKRQPEGLSRPDFMVRERGLTAAQRGTALHLAMQYLPLEGDHSPETIREELRRLTAEGFLTSQQGEAVPPEVPAAFFASELGRQLLAAREVHREFKFSILMPAADYGPGLEGEEVLLQGVVDCWFDGLEGITVLDFKSDRIRPGGEAARGEEYRPQLEAYSRALERITGRRVAHRILWFFATGTGLEL